LAHEDTYCWGLTGSRTFSTRFATWAAHKSFGYNDVAWSFKWIWQLNIMPKMKIFLWQMLHNALPLRGALVKRGMTINPACPLCMNDIESNDHLFWECPSIKEMWRLPQQHKWLHLLDIQDGSMCLEDLVLRCKQSRNKEDIVKVANLFWHIWKERNAFIFQHEIFRPLRTLI